ncbi:MAG: hypothetical protein WC755_09505 [Candidatus Woesearchaeota archaeon]|jgi:NDP-sugar pyrophosphorylase family protein
MKAEVLVGGDQTRIGFSAEVKPKSLLVTKNGETILIDILKQLDVPEISDIEIFVGDNRLIEEFVDNNRSEIKKRILINNIKLPTLGQYVFNYKGNEPVTFVFGDMYIPKPQLSSYIKYASNLESDYSAVIGVSDTQVGDYKVEIQGNRVKSISKEIGQKFTCGLFSILDIGIIKKLKETSKLTEVFAQIPQTRTKMGYFETKGLVDIDTPESISLL